MLLMCKGCPKEYDCRNYFNLVKQERSPEVEAPEPSSDDSPVALMYWGVMAIAAMAFLYVCFFSELP